MPAYALEGDGYCTKVVVNSIARFRLRLMSLTHAHDSKNIFEKYTVSIHDPSGHCIVVQRRVLAVELLELTYQPMSTGQYQLSIFYEERVDQQLTIDVIDDEENALIQFKPFGPGLQRAILGLPTEFYIQLYSQTTKTINHDHLQFSMKPSYQAEIDYEKHMATVRYTANEEIDFPVHILEHDRDILQSPFTASVKKVSFRDGSPFVRVHGLLQNMIIHRPVDFQVRSFILFSSVIRLMFSVVRVNEP
jgi:hypothetical protein